MGFHIIFPFNGPWVSRTIKFIFIFTCRIPNPGGNFIHIYNLYIFSSYSDVAEKYSVCWRIGNFLSGWRLSPFYVALGVALLMWPNALWLSSVAGIQLLILAILRLLTIFRFNTNSSRCEGLLQKQSNQHHIDYFDK